MCGIVYVKRLDNKPAAKQIEKRYKKQKSRGSEGFAFMGIKQSGTADKVMRFQYEPEMMKALKDVKYHEILMHHRYPTSTPNVPESTHPILVSHEELMYDYYVTHNGVITNDTELKEAHNKLGYKYLTEIYPQYVTAAGKTYHDAALWNDSEALAIELARTIEAKQDSVKAEGNIAYIVLQVEKISRKSIALYYGTNGGNPLTIQTHKDFVCIASEGGERVNDDICYRLNLRTLETEIVPTVKMVSKVKAHSSYAKGRYSGGYLDNRSEHEFMSDDYVGALPKTRHNEYSKVVSQVEAEMSSIEDEIIGVSADIELAIHEGDSEQEIESKAELKELQARQRRVERQYETLTLTG